MIKRINPRGTSPLRLYLMFLGAAWLMLLAARMAFAVYSWNLLDDVSLDNLTQAFYIGFRFDGRIAAIITFPIGLLLTIPPLGRRLADWAGRIFIFYLLSFFCVWSLYGTDFGFHAYLGVRLNATLFELLEDFRVSADMVWASYPVIWIIIILLLASLLSALSFKRLAAMKLKEYWSLPGKLLAWLLGFVIFFWAAYGQVNSNLFPLRWSNAYFSPDPAVTSLALNPLQNLYDTYQATKDDGFDLDAARDAYPLMASYLRVERSDDAGRLEYAGRRPARPLPAGSKRPNVVVIVMESMGYQKSSFAPGNDDPTPFLTQLAAESLYYPQFYSNTRTTARGVFTTITGIPDVTESSTGSRSQLVVDQRVIADQFDGYDKYYMLGGNTAWANIRGVLSNNIQGLRILEDSYWKAPNVDVWGISDWDLLNESHELFATLKERPFLAVIQTSSFHKPYTVPDGIPGFAKQPLSEETRLNYGFVSEDEYNSMRFADFAIEEFFRLARQSDYYENTIFMLLGDHGIKDNSANMDAAYAAADLAPWHVPMILHAPGRIRPGIDAAPASQIDVFPTLAALAGVSHINWTLGRDLLNAELHGDRVAFISGNSNTPIRLVQDGYCYVDNRAGQEALYRLGDDAAVDMQVRESGRFERMRSLAVAFQATSKYLLYNNKK